MKKILFNQRIHFNIHLCFPVHNIRRWIGIIHLQLRVTVYQEEQVSHCFSVIENLNSRLKFLKENADKVWQRTKHCKQYEGGYDMVIWGCFAAKIQNPAYIQDLGVITAAHLKICWWWMRKCWVRAQMLILLRCNLKLSGHAGNPSEILHSSRPNCSQMTGGSVHKVCWGALTSLKARQHSFVYVFCCCRYMRKTKLSFHFQRKIIRFYMHILCLYMNLSLWMWLFISLFSVWTTVAYSIFFCPSFSL